MSTSRLSAALVILAVVAAGPLLAGCSVDQLVENATGGQVDLPDSTVPEDFPDAVPLYDGEVLTAASAGNADGKIWNVSVRVPDVAALDTITTELTDAGLEAQLQGPSTADGGTVIASTAEFGVAVVVVRDDSGFVANYTVTATPQ